MKKNAVKTRRVPRRLIALLAAIVVLGGGALAVTLAYGRLAALCRESAAVRDVSTQVTVVAGTLVRPETILDALGVRNGANLAEIDFAARRAELLRRQPAIKSITIVRHVPDRVEIAVVERTPAVRLTARGEQKGAARVADSEGAVFTCRRNTAMLPIIREKGAATPPGGRLTGRTLAALQLVEALLDAEYASLGVLEADASKDDFVLATLASYALAKIAWDGMDEPTAGNRPNLVKKLDRLKKAVGTDLVVNPRIWDATGENIIANRKDAIP